MKKFILIICLLVVGYGDAYITHRPLLPPPVVEMEIAQH